ncbi:MAG: class I SAM-dependent methyltransferase [Oscillospiraceae bacterium]|nr:class I SAM-dependent methyltransferase [Oscillospiraceae bacterium]
MIKINNRLKTIADFVRKGSVVADIGTDHAFLPIWLVQNNITNRVIASDINIGPCNKAKRNVKLHGLETNITIVQTDGLNGIEKYQPEDIIIAGMGGELIWEIINAGFFLVPLAKWGLSTPTTLALDRGDSVTFILQPMTRQPLLRQLLLQHGFEIIDERLSTDDGRIYQIMQVSYTGTPQIYTAVELLLGRHNIINRQEIFAKFLERNIKLWERKIKGKLSAGIDVTAEIELLVELRRLR